MITISLSIRDFLDPPAENQGFFGPAPKTQYKTHNNLHPKNTP